ncbi:MAG: DNA translocase FtsK, partial [Oscillospiraceae bacterium]|nr:DNA translocase FtsK [Oscillospiraceae bacterium]
PRRRTSSAPEKPVKEKPARKRAGIDIPLDGEPSAMESGAKKEFFTRKSDTVRTPDQVLEQKAAPEPAPAAQEAAPVKEPVSAKTKKAQLQQEVESAAQEVSQAIEQELAQGEEAYRYPPITLLEENHADNCTEVGAELRNNSRRLAEALRSFGVDAAAGDVVHGPSVTRYEFTLEQGVKLSKITNLSDDIALALGASGVRVAPVPNKISVVGIEVPNRTVTAVRIRDVIESREFTRHPSSVAFAVGKDIGGNNIVGNIAKLPHVLIAGTTGSGKSVCTNSLIVSILYKSTPDEVRFIMVDPKMVELAPYNGIPHLLIPVVTDPKKAAGALQWAVFEMMKRYKMFSEKGVKDLAGYNALAEVDEDVKKLPTVVVVIDELADLMLVAAKEVEESICRVAQMGRAAGMHLVVATQRPSADVITGLMKANIPSRIAFAVASSMESRIILDTPGAEKLVGKGDMLYAPLGDSKPTRVQGCFITPEEIERVVAFVKDAAGEAHYDQDVIEKIQQAVDAKSDKGKASPTDGAADGDDGDELLPAAVEVVLETGQASVSMLQRRLKLGYSRAARLVDQMEERGYVGPFEGSKPRQLLITREKWQELQMAKGAAPAETPPAADRYGSIHDVFESHDALD